MRGLIDGGAGATDHSRDADGDVAGANGHVLRADDAFHPVEAEHTLLPATSHDDAGSAIDCGTFSPWSAAIAALIVTATWAGPVPAEEQCSPFAAFWAHSLRKPFSVSPEIGTIGCPESRRARTVPVEPPCT